MAAERLVTVTEDNLAGQECEFCHRPLEAGEQVVVCPRCRAVHHVDCWRRKGGCARQGCRQVAVEILSPQRPDSPVPASSPSLWQRLRLWQRVLLMAVLVLLVGGLAFAAWRQAAQSVSNETKLALVVPADFWEGERYTQLADQFEASHPGVTVNVMSTPYAGYEQKLAIMLAARDQVDVFVLAPSRVGLYADSGALLPLDSKVEELKGSGRMDLAELAYRYRDFVYGMRRGREWPALFVVSRRSGHPDLSWELLISILSETVKDPAPPPGFSLEPRVIPVPQIP